VLSIHGSQMEWKVALISLSKRVAPRIQQKSTDSSVTELARQVKRGEASVSASLHVGANGEKHLGALAVPGRGCHV
jgi:hypothetical protein